MGYHTDFYGSFTITPPLPPERVEYLTKFSETRRMQRKPEIAEHYPDEARAKAGLPLGKEAGYYVGATGDSMSGYKDPSVVDCNRPPQGQPGLWCQWIPTEDGTQLFDCGEKFYDYVEWLEYLVEHFFDLWGHKLNGAIEWYGEDHDDRGVIYAKDNRIEAVESQIINRGPSWQRD